MAGMSFGNVMRTWFYLDRILEWYHEFNHVRTAFFRERKVNPADFRRGFRGESGSED